MHAKHRNGSRNGYRSNAMGMGGSASRIHPEGTMRSHRMYNSDHRRFNRGGSHSKQFQQSRGGGIFVEAGKLAAEYLVSTGVLPPNALSGKWKGDSLKNMGNYRDGRGSIRSRLGNGGLNAGLGRRRYSDDHGLKGCRSSVRERKQTGLTQEADGVEKSKLLEDTNDGTLSNCDAANGELVGNSDDAIEINNMVEAVKVGRNDDLQQKCDDLVSEEDHVDLVKHSKFVHVPTRVCSSLTVKNSKGFGVHVVDVKVENSIRYAPTMEPERSNSILTERVEKREIDFDTDYKDDVKKLRSSLSDSMENHSLLQDPTTSLNAHLTTLSPDQKSLDISVFPENHDDLCEFMEEKQLFRGSFKTCDLNLVENGDVSENCYGADHMLGFLPNNKNSKSVMNVNGIEVIDLEKDSTPEDKSFSNPPVRRGDTILSDVDGFANSAHNDNGIPNVPDGYGLMISDLPNTEVILDDDDPIYMSLGEIPISLLGAWEHPSQDYGKPF